MNQFFLLYLTLAIYILKHKFLIHYQEFIHQMLPPLAEFFLKNAFITAIKEHGGAGESWNRNVSLMQEVLLY